MSKYANLRLTAKLLPIIAPFIAKNDIRDYLNAINVRPHKDGGAIICATNGQSLGAVHDRKAVCEHEVTLRFSKQMHKACVEGIANDRTVVMLGERLAVIEHGTTEVCIQDGDPEVSGKYPRYESVIPTESMLRPGLTGMYAGRLLNKFKKAAQAAATANERDPYAYSGLQFFSIIGPEVGFERAVVRMPTAPDFVGVIMPMRIDKEIAVLPQWAVDMHAASAPAEGAEVPA